MTLVPSSAANALNDPQFYVQQHYLDFLTREPDTAGLAFWMNQITSCGTDADCAEIKRINVSAAFYLSIEFQQTGFFVYRLYKGAYGNVPGKPVPVRLQEFLPDTRRVGRGVLVGAAGWEQQLEANKQAFAAEFATRARFLNTYQSMSPEQFVDALNANAGGVLSQAERDAIVNDLESGARNRAQGLRAVSEDADIVRQEFNRAFVLMQYCGYLRRDPDSGPDTNFDGFNFWLNKLDNHGGNFISAEMVKAFILSQEYRQRFGQP